MQECPIARHSPLPELQALVQVFCPAAVSPNCVVPMLSGLDYFLLPNFLDGLLQPGGYARMIAERDAWFASPACFIRNGPNHLAAMKQQQAVGYDLLRSVDQGVGNSNDDYLPVPESLKPAVLGGSRRHHASDQALRAGGILQGGCSLLPACDITFSQAMKASDGTSTNAPCSAPTADLSDTDNEDQVDRTRRTARGHGKRKHLVSPSVARSRVYSLKHHASSINKRLKTDPSNKDKLSITSAASKIPETYGYATGTCKHEPSAAGTLPQPHSKREGKDDYEERPLRYLVDGQHLAALMAVGVTPSSPV